MTEGAQILSFFDRFCRHQRRSRIHVQKGGLWVSMFYATNIERETQSGESSHSIRGVWSVCPALNTADVALTQAYHRMRCLSPLLAAFLLPHAFVTKPCAEGQFSSVWTLCYRAHYIASQKRCSHTYQNRRVGKLQASGDCVLQARLIPPM